MATTPYTDLPVRSASIAPREPSARSGVVTGRQILALDGLRGIAVLLVVFSHIHYAIAPAGAGWVAFKALATTGWTGVDLFFVLSGFLITSILLDSKGATNYFRSFYARRTLRIFPLYYLVLSAALLGDRLFGGAWSHYNLPLPVDQKLYFVFLNNWWPLIQGSWHSNMVGHFWSLAVEEQFYLMWSLCVWLLPSKWLGRLCLASYVAVLLLRIIWIAQAGPSQALMENTFTRMDTLLAGAGCALLVRRKDWLDRARRALLPVGIACLLGLEAIFLGAGELVRAGRFMQSIGLSALAALFATLILFAYAGPVRGRFGMRVLQSRFLTRTGRYSFGIYVYHVPLFLISQHWLYTKVPAFNFNPWMGLAYVLGLAGLTFLVAMASYEFFEKRFLDYKKYFAPRFE